jgi:hypothetical protein
MYDELFTPLYDVSAAISAVTTTAAAATAVAAAPVNAIAIIFAFLDFYLILILFPVI